MVELTFIEGFSQKEIAEIVGCPVATVKTRAFYAKQRLRRWLCGKHKEPGTGLTRFPDEYLYQTLGLICLPLLPQRLPWAKA